jgi:aromatic-L-amino-acid decarboxylase
LTRDGGGHPADPGDVPAAFHQAAALAARYLDTITARPVWQPVPAGDRQWLSAQSLPVTGRRLPDLVRDIQDRVLPYPMGNGHPRFFGWVNSPPSVAGVLVEPLAAALNPSCAGGEHAGVLLERTVVRWLAELAGYPHSPGGGLLTSGASMATLICLAAARHRAAERDGWDVRADGLAGRAPMVLYVSTEGHSCALKAAELLGLGSRQVRRVPVGTDTRLDPAALRTALERDRAAGLRPFAVVASMGTVSTGAIDPLEEVAALAAEYGLWLHVDGAYGALATLADGDGATDAPPGLARAASGLAHADSLALDPHKWLGVPVDCGCALFGDPSLVRSAFSLVPAYLRDESGDPLGWFAEYGPEQTRPFRALRAWATLSHLGRDGVVDLVRRTCALARALGELVDQAPDFELLAPVATSITAFRFSPPELAPAAADRLNRAIPAAVQRRGRAFLTGTQVHGVEALRACFLNPATDRDDLDVLLAEIRAAAAEGG